MEEQEIEKVLNAFGEISVYYKLNGENLKADFFTDRKAEEFIKSLKE